MSKHNSLEKLAEINSHVQVHDQRDRIVVQVGQCSASIGAYDELESIKTKYSETHRIEVAGCSGACFSGPRVTGLDSSDIFSNDQDFFKSQTRYVLQGIGEIAWDDIRQYISIGGFEGLAKALSVTSEEVIDIVSDSGLRGRGGAYFPVALKWKSASSQRSAPVVLVNAEEGEPGLFKDRHLMEGMPFRVIEGALIAAYASKSEEILIYVNAEAELAYSRLNISLQKCQDLGLVGKNVLGTDFSVNIRLFRGAGGYVCGEESTLINTLEGRRREPRLRPPFPTESGFRSLPTVVNNVETLCNVPLVLSSGPEKFRSNGTSDAPGTKLLSLSGNMPYRGLAEVPFGITLLSVLQDVGGIKDLNDLSGVAVGGPSSGILPTHLLDLEILPGIIDGKNVMLGAGGVVALSKNTDPYEATIHLSKYNAAESCGKCTPCREGAPKIVSMLESIRNSSDRSDEFKRLEMLATTVNAASLCGLGQAAGNPFLSYLNHFSQEQGD